MSAEALLDIVRRVVQQELQRTRSTRLGVVSAVYRHDGGSSSDGQNHEVDLKLKHDDLELTRVPVAVPWVGFAAPPRVGDLVMVQFLDGDLNQPFVSGRLYHADDAPPRYDEDDVVLEHRVPDGTLNQLRFAADGSIFLQRETDADDPTKSKSSLRIDGGSGEVELKVGDKIVLTLTHDAKIKIVADGKPIDVQCDTLTVDGHVIVKGDLTVGRTTKTKISGNRIQGM